MIRNEIQETGSPWQASLNLIDAIEENPKNYSDEYILALIKFLYHCGFYKTLFDFVIRHLNKEEFNVPWTYFLETLAQSTTTIDEPTLEYLLRSIKTQKAYESAGKAILFRKKIPELESWNAKRIQKINVAYVQKKTELLQEVHLLRSQQLYDAEKNQLVAALSQFPGDLDILKELKEFNQRHALDLLQKKGRQISDLQSLKNSEKKEEVKPPEGLSESLKTLALKYPEMAQDLAIVSISFEQYQLAEDLIKMAPDSPSKTWLELEIFLHQKRFLDLLSSIHQLKKKFGADPEAPFAFNYLEAQALWGLGQKEKAQELLEKLLQARPNYRFGETLLYLWRSES